MTTPVIKNFNETVKKLQIDEKMFNSDTNIIERAIHQHSDKIGLVEANLKYFAI